MGIRSFPYFLLLFCDSAMSLQENPDEEIDRESIADLIRKKYSDKNFWIYRFNVFPKFFLLYCHNQLSYVNYQVNGVEDWGKNGGLQPTFLTNQNGKLLEQYKADGKYSLAVIFVWHYQIH